MEEVLALHLHTQGTEKGEVEVLSGLLVQALAVAVLALMPENADIYVSQDRGLALGNHAIGCECLSLHLPNMTEHLPHLCHDLTQLLCFTGEGET